MFNLGGSRHYYMSLGGCSTLRASMVPLGGSSYLLGDSRVNLHSSSNHLGSLWLF